MVLKEGVHGPFWMTPQERVAMKFSQYDKPQLKDNKNAALLGNNKTSNMDMYAVKGNRLGKLKDIARENSISITNKIRKKRVKI